MMNRIRTNKAWKRTKNVAAALTVAGFSSIAFMAPAHAEAKPAPQEFCDGLDTATAWTSGVAGALAVIGLICIGIGMFFAHRNEMGDGPMKKLGFWLGGACLVAGAAALAGVFVGNSLNCS